MISDALAEPPFTITTTGTPGNSSPGSASSTVFESGCRPGVDNKSAIQKLLAIRHWRLARRRDCFYVEYNTVNGPLPTPHLVRP